MTKRYPRLSRQQMLESVPVLNPGVRWEELDSGQIMVVYRKQPSLLARLLMKLFAVPETSQLLLDETGTRVVRQIDGNKTIADLITHVAKELRLSRKESEVSLLKFMDMMGRRRLVGFLVRRSAKGG